MNEFEKAINLFLNELGLQMLLQYNANNLRASGNFEGFMDVQKNKLLLAGYALYITEGNTRQPGKPPPVFEIFKWLFDKGITPRDRKTGRFISYEAAAYIISRTIGREGTKFTHSRPIDFDQAKDQAYDKSKANITKSVIDRIFKKTMFKGTNKIVVEL